MAIEGKGTVIKHHAESIVNKKNHSIFVGLFKIGIFILLLAGIFFLSAGRLNLVMAWVYIAMVLANTSITSLIMDPELIAERSEIKKGTKSWDIIPAVVMGRTGPLVILIVAGLDVRFGWSPQVPLTLQIIAFGIVVLGFLISDWAVISNQFFSGVVRIQNDRGHTVVTTGPYHYVRHPGYVGAILHNMAVPVILNSLWAFIPVGVVVCITITRTKFEDRTLQEELDGYKAYTNRVRYRLLPSIW
jgi:protein-S-isoprenylcysteine O-methyltransferase Ste14